jgi:hypothetical protein
MGVKKGLVVAVGNLVAVAGVIQDEAGTSLQVIPFVLLVGAVPALVAGAIAGALAKRFERSALLLRMLVIAIPAFGLVLLLGRGMLGPHENALVIAACVPTAFAVLALALWTRGIPLPPRIPVATLRPPTG